MNHSTNIVWGERGELFLNEKALRAYFCAGVHIILARIVDKKGGHPLADKSRAVVFKPGVPIIGQL